MSTAIEHYRAPGSKHSTLGRIGFDTWCLGSYARNQGVHEYTGNLLQHFRELAPEYGVEVVPYTTEVANGVPNNRSLFMPAPGFCPRQSALLKSQRLWRYGGACALAAADKVDLVFSPHCTTLYIGKLAPHVVTIHDVIPFLMPVGSRRVNATLRLGLWWSAKSSRAIITPSAHSKQDLIDYYHLLENKVAVVHMGYDKAVFNATPPDPKLFAALAKRAGIQRPYILHHGVIKPNKNLKRLVRAYQLLCERNRNLQLDLVLAGQPGWNFEEVRTAANQGGGRVIFTGPLNIDDLAILVKRASLAVFPSLYEGFCLPMIEAMACGVPALASNASCLPEISGGVLRYFDPLSVEEMSACIEDALEKTTISRELSEKGRARALEFDWRRCAKETLAVLKQQLAGDV